MNIITFLEEILGSSTRQSDECLFYCPFCSHRKRKLSINMVNMKWKCWICGAKGGHVIWLLKKLNISKPKISRARTLFKDSDIQTYKDTTVEASLTLPHDYKPLWRKQESYDYLHALSYLKKRGITTDDILRYRMGYCESGAYTGRIIVPSYDKDDNLNYFTARAFFDSTYKYKNPKISKNIVVFENMIDWDEPVVLVEGVFDAIALRRNAIPLMGTSLQSKLLHAILRNGTKDVIIFLDEDARLHAINIGQELREYGIRSEVVITDSMDAADLGFDRSWQKVSGAKNIGFSDYIKYQLSDI